MDDSAGYSREFVADFYDYVDPYVHRPDIAFYTTLATEHGGPVLELGCGTGRVAAAHGQSRRRGHWPRRVGRDASDLPGQVGGGARRGPGPRSASPRRHAQLRPGPAVRPGHHPLSPLPAPPHRRGADGVPCLCISPPGARRRAGPGRVQPQPWAAGGPEVLRGVGTGADLCYARPAERRPNGPERLRGPGQPGHPRRAHLLRHPPERGAAAPGARLPMRYFFRYELEHLLVRAGFRVEAVYGDFDGSHVGAGAAGELVFVARRE